MKVVGGSASQMLARSLASELGTEMVPLTSKIFPDGECYVRLEGSLEGEDVVLVQTTYPNDKFVEALLLADAIRECGARSLTTVVPYFGYARQDKKFKDGEAISARAMAKHIQLQSDKIITIDIHNPNVLQWFDAPAIDVSAMPQIAAHFTTLDDAPEIILAPDEGAKHRAVEVAEILGCGADYLEKHRIDGNTVEMKSKNLDVNGKVVAIVDDIISTGGTIIKATESLKAQGARKVFAACTHGLFANNALERLKGVCDFVISTDTLETSSSKVSVAKEVVKALAH
jgi:ribose-phosphate pyrophosphokinase